MANLKETLKKYYWLYFVAPVATWATTTVLLLEFDKMKGYVLSISVFFGCWINILAFFTNRTQYAGFGGKPERWEPDGSNDKSRELNAWLFSIILLGDVVLSFYFGLVK